MTDSCSPYQEPKINLQEAITYRGQTPLEAFGYVGLGMDIPFDFYTSRQAAEINEEYEYHYEFLNALTDIFGIPADDRSMTKKQYKDGMTAWRRCFPNDTYEPDCNPGGGPYHM